MISSKAFDARVQLFTTICCAACCCNWPMPVAAFFAAARPGATADGWDVPHVIPGNPRYSELIKWNPKWGPAQQVLPHCCPIHSCEVLSIVYYFFVPITTVSICKWPPDRHTKLVSPSLPRDHPSSLLGGYCHQRCQVSNRPQWSLGQFTEPRVLDFLLKLREEGRLLANADYNCCWAPLPHCQLLRYTLMVGLLL